MPGYVVLGTVSDPMDGCYWLSYYAAEKHEETRLLAQGPHKGQSLRSSIILPLRANISPVTLYVRIDRHPGHSI